MGHASEFQENDEEKIVSGCCGRWEMLGGIQACCRASQGEGGRGERKGGEGNNCKMKHQTELVPS